MDSTEKITEDDLLQRFEEIKDQMDELLKKYCINEKKEPHRSIQNAPVVAESIFSYEIHASS